MNFPDDYFEYYTEEELEDFFFTTDDAYIDGYPDELIPEHAFTNKEEATS